MVGHGQTFATVKIHHLIAHIPCGNTGPHGRECAQFQVARPIAALSKSTKVIGNRETPTFSKESTDLVAQRYRDDAL